MPRQHKIDSAGGEESRQRSQRHYAPPTATTIPPAILGTLFQFLGRIPATGDVIEWIHSFGELLCAEFPDVDLVSVRVNLHCRLANLASEYLTLDHTPPIDLLTQSLGGHTSQLLHTPLVVEAPTFQPEAFHEPRVISYVYAGDSLGSIMLLRNKREAPISEATLAAFEALEPFLVFALTDLVARYNYAKPISRVFRDVLRAIGETARLTSRELEVLTLHMFGRKYDEIARRLYISIDTVKKHVKKIHRKTGARSATELFARYFSPLIDTDPPDPGPED